jgi:hypothetical protein
MAIFIHLDCLYVLAFTNAVCVSMSIQLRSSQSQRGINKPSPITSGIDTVCLYK